MRTHKATDKGRLISTHFIYISVKLANNQNKKTSYIEITEKANAQVTFERLELGR